ncbi:hypothetical protein RFI_04655 [Reticulomyxa filosa]|uniref:Kelch motif family protein n=1 Tax=Reticulomyxa filosa TaxID=46433 RepID=X6P311_RETFI|nr:hypothetical protein RFI_04655 [Reticulomyxa filosa]|eukprot:ETO32464.1 hypothetical protein RFI_04655 [Reticulomyxa filosa]
MGNRTTTQKSTNRQTEQKQTLTISTPFQSLKDLPTLLCESQCVLYKHEILICGGAYKRNCYSYHTLKNEYKLICEYPYDINLWGHCVIKLVDNKDSNKDSNKITLLSFGGNRSTKKFTLIMNYVSVWSDDNQMNKLNDYNRWIPFTDNQHHPIHIGRDDCYFGVTRAVIGGSNNHLLFIIYSYNNISVFNLNTFQFIRYDILPTKRAIIFLVLQEQETMKINGENKKKNYEMLLFVIMKDYQLNMMKITTLFNFINYLNYTYVHVNDFILFFGGYGWKDNTYATSKSVHKYSIQENKWITFEHTLPVPLYGRFGILNEDNTCIHIIGGNFEKSTAPTHMKTKVSEWRNASHLDGLMILTKLLLNIIKYNSRIKHKEKKKSEN